MNNAQQPAVDLITPAEAKFWQEYADKAPQLLHNHISTITGDLSKKFGIATIASLGLGVSLTAISFTKLAPGKWKWLTIPGATASFAASYLGYVMVSANKQNQKLYDVYANTLNQSPELRQELAKYLSTHINAENIQHSGIELAVIGATMEFGMNTPSLRNQVMQAAGIENTQQNNALQR